MKKDKSLICVIVDKSGSMRSIQEETISGFNNLIEEQKKVPGECLVSLIQFDHDYEENYLFKDINEVEPLNKETYTPRGYTKLFDSMGRTINTIGEKLSSMPEDERPERVIVAVVTDGFDNMSSEFTQRQIKEMVEHQTEKYNWSFVYLGANQDAVLEGSKSGISKMSSLSYAHNGVGVTDALRSLSAGISTYRMGQTNKVVFTKEDTQNQAVNKS